MFHCLYSCHPFFKGVERWMLKMTHKFYVEFVDSTPFLYEIPQLKKRAGRVRTAGGHGAGNITFIEVFGAGCGILFVLVEKNIDHEGFA